MRQPSYIEHLLLSDDIRENKSGAYAMAKCVHLSCDETFNDFCLVTADPD